MMQIGKKQIRTVLELLTPEQTKMLDAFDVALSDDEAVTHVACKQTGKAWVLPRLPASEQTEERLNASAQLVGKQLADHLAELDAKRKAEAAARPS
jgi:lipase chaperone LimK